MKTTVWLEDGENAHEEKGSVCDVAAYEAGRWMASGLFDWYVTFSFDERTARNRALVDPRHVYAFMKERLREFGYYGPYVIVPHDNSKTRYYHAHCLLQNYRDGVCERLSERMRIHGNVQKTDDGPIRGNGPFFYCANRAMSNQWSNDPLFEERLEFVRRPRRRGSGSTKAKRPTGRPTAHV